jgi:hypothetical protein
VARPTRLTMPPKPVWASGIISASPSVHILIYQENLPCQKDGVFCEPERHRHHDLHF